MKRLCIICGATVRNMNPKTVTCSPVCSLAKKKGFNEKLKPTTEQWAKLHEEVEEQK